MLNETLHPSNEPNPLIAEIQRRLEEMRQKRCEGELDEDLEIKRTEEVLAYKDWAAVAREELAREVTKKLIPEDDPITAIALVLWVFRYAYGSNGGDITKVELEECWAYLFYTGYMETPSLAILEMIAAKCEELYHDPEVRSHLFQPIFKARR